MWLFDLFKKKKKVEKSYIERDTECDLCEYRDECIGNLIECTTLSDTRQHFTRCLVADCKKYDI